MARQLDFTVAWLLFRPHLHQIKDLHYARVLEEPVSKQMDAYLLDGGVADQLHYNQNLRKFYLLLLLLMLLMLLLFFMGKPEGL